MKHLKSSLHGLRELFDRSVTVRHIAEPIISFDAPSRAADIRAFMDAHDYDAVGVRQDGLIAGYVQRADLSGGTLADHQRAFDPALLLHEATPLSRALEALVASPRAFVVLMGQVGGIVTKGDLQKAPVRMWLFALLSLLEMQFLRVIRGMYPDDSWATLVPADRLDKARALLAERRLRNEATDMADCLQFSDKRAILAKTGRVRDALGFTSKRMADATLLELGRLRDELAHAQDIVAGRWPALATLAREAEVLLARCEEIV